jgi:hypothetical protein
MGTGKHLNHMEIDQMKIYRFIFYAVFKVYHLMDDDAPGGFGVMVCALLQFLPLLTLVLYLDHLTQGMLGVGKGTVWVLMVPLMIFNYWYMYKKFGVDRIIKEWESQPRKVKRRWGLWSLLYFVLAVSFFILS